MAAARLVEGGPGAAPRGDILLPEGRVPWSGHSGRYAAEQVMAEIETHKTTIVFCNTRSLAELIFQDLWKVNAMNLPIGVHHGSLAREARRKVEGAMAAGRLRALVATSSLDLGVDWGDVDRSEEHTSELQSLMRISYAVFCLKKQKTEYKNHTNKPTIV